MTNYGTVIDNTLHTAPRAFMLHGAMVTNPKAEHFAALNEEREKQGLPKYYPISDDPAPTPPDGKVVRFNGYAVVAGWIAPQYSFEDAPPPPPRRWTRLAIKTALAQAGMLSQALAYLAQVEIATGYSAAEALQDCDYIEEGYPDAEKWDAILDGAASALGKTRAEIDAFLDAIPQEGGA